MSVIARALHSLPLLYVCMLWPSRPVLEGLLWEDYYYPWMMRESGIWTIYLLIVTLSVTPVLLLLGKLGAFPSLGRWLLQRRRHFGLATFIYASLHLAHYVKETWDLATILLEGFELKFLSAWLGFAIFLVLATTSNKWSTRKLGARWKSLHRWVYAAAALSFLHWYLFDFYTGRVLFWAGVLVSIKLLHVAFVSWRRKQSNAIAATR